jgi:hypothetical protein
MAVVYLARDQKLDRPFALNGVKSGTGRGWNWRRWWGRHGGGVNDASCLRRWTRPCRRVH